MPALAPFACACLKPNEIPIAAWLLSISLYSLYSLSTLSLYSLSLYSLSLSLSQVKGTGVWSFFEMKRDEKKESDEDSDKSKKE